MSGVIPARDLPVVVKKWGVRTLQKCENNLTPHHHSPCFRVEATRSISQCNPIPPLLLCQTSQTKLLFQPPRKQLSKRKVFCPGSFGLSSSTHWRSSWRTNVGLLSPLGWSCLSAPPISPSTAWRHQSKSRSIMRASPKRVGSPIWCGGKIAQRLSMSKSSLVSTKLAFPLPP